MNKNGKKGVVKGGGSGFLISLLIHAAAFVLAGALVIFTVVNKEEKTFDPPKPVERPKMKLKKPKVRVKKTARPKSTSRIVTKVNKAQMPDIQLPAMGGISDGLAGGIGGFEFDLDLGEPSVFGNAQSIGNDFEGTVFSLIYDREGGPIAMDVDAFRDVLRKYVLSGWKDRVLARYYRSPKKLYSTHILVPPIPTALAPGVFGVPDLEDYFLFIRYEGQLVYPEDIKFRFWGIGDAYIFVNVDGEEVLMSAWHFHHPWFGWWQSSAGGDRSHLLGNQLMVVGDWIELKAGEPVDMKVLFGEWKGGQVAGMLLVEVDGVDYPTSRTGGPLLPAFKTQEFSWETLTEISRFLAADECSLTNGPVFNDFHDPEHAQVVEAEPAAQVDAVEPKITSKEQAPRFWNTMDGKSIEATFKTAVAGSAILETVRGKQIKVPLKRLSADDRSYIRLSMPPTLDVNFSKTTKPRKFGETFNGNAPSVRGNFYTFATAVKQTSVRPYGHTLTAEYFAVGDEIGGDKHILLDHQKADFTLTRKNDFSFEFAGPPVELIDYVVNEERRGVRYGGFLAVVTDSQGDVIYYETPSKNLFRNLGSLRNVKVGWYFDKDCKRCLPTPPIPWSVPANEN